MLYYFFTWLNKHYDVSGARLFEYNSFRTAMAVLFALIIATVYGRRVIDLLRKPQLAEGDQILATPTLVRKVPEPIRKIIGDLSNEEKVLVGLNIIPA